MRIKLGNDFFDAKTGRETPVSWDTERLINPHLLILGASGVGKTHTIRKMIRRGLASGQCVRYHVFDVHGDIEIPGASEVLFSESVPYGLNPLQVNPDPHFGGVRKCIQNFIRTINAASTTPLGVKQEAALSNLLIDVYREFEFDLEDPATWDSNGAQARLVGGHTTNRLYLDVPFEENAAAKAAGHIRFDGAKKLWYCQTEDYTGELTRWKPAYRHREYPAVKDVLDHAERVHLERFLGTDQKAIAALKALNTEAKAYQSKLRTAARVARLYNGEFDVEAREALESARQDACEAYERYAKSVQTGHELESLIRYDSPDVMKSTLSRLQNLYRTGIFKDTPPPFDPAAPVWRYKINALSQEEKKLFVLFMLQRLFYKAVQRGETGDVVEVVVLDELGVYCTAADTEEGDGIIGTICREGRKFGLAFWGASQSPASIPESLLSSTATKMILGLDEMFWPMAVSKLRVQANCLEWIRAQVSITVQMKVRGAMRNPWLWVNLEEGAAERRIRAV